MPTRHIWQQILHTGKPTDAAFRSLYHLDPIPFIQRNTYGAANWPDPAQPPPSAWLDRYQNETVAPNGWVTVDHEDWLQDTQANRLATADKFVTFYNSLKARRPEINVAFYSYCPKRDFFRARQGVGAADYIAWQAENTDMAAMAAVVDGFLPSIYHFYNIEVNGVDANQGVQAYYTENLRECRRLRDTYGSSSRPIYPYIWWRAHSHNGLLDDAAWIPQIETALSDADGCILWGGFTEPWDNTAHWWNLFKARLPRRVHVGAFT